MAKIRFCCRRIDSSKLSSTSFTHHEKFQHIQWYLGVGEECTTIDHLRTLCSRYDVVRALHSGSSSSHLKWFSWFFNGSMGGYFLPPEPDQDPLKLPGGIMSSRYCLWSCSVACLWISSIWFVAEELLPELEPEFFEEPELPPDMAAMACAMAAIAW